MNTDLAKIKVGDIFSEISHYKLVNKGNGGYTFMHNESKQTVTLSESYVQGLLVSADQFEKEIKVGKEDKFWTKKQIDDLEVSVEQALNLRMEGASTVKTIPREGDLKLKGIRTIFNEIYSSEVFTICFQKADKPLSRKKFEELKTAQIEDALERIQKVKDAKKGVTNAAGLILRELQEKPVLPYEPGEERVLRGFKVEFSSYNGIYEVVDMDIPDPDKKGDNLRQVNINSIKWLIFKGVKYVVE